MQQALRSGRIWKEADGRIDSGRADVEWERNTSAAAQKCEGSLQYQQAQETRMRIAAECARLEFEECAGSLVRTERARRHLFEVGRRVRERLDTLPDRMAGVIAAESDAEVIHAALLGGIREALEELEIGLDERARK